MDFDPHAVVVYEADADSALEEEPERLALDAFAALPWRVHGARADVRKGSRTFGTRDRPTRTSARVR